MIARFTVVALAVLASAGAAAISGAQARNRHGGGDHPYGGGVPYLDVKTSCSDAQKFSSGSGDKNTAFKGCMQDETNAKTELAKRWSQFKGKDKQDCVEQSRQPSPSYVEVLTCLEMDSGSMQNSPGGGKPMPQIGGPVAPGLTGPGPGPGVPNFGGMPRT